MGFRVVFISRTAAAGGEPVGQAVAQALGVRYVDAQVIERAAQRAQVSPAHRRHAHAVSRALACCASGPDVA